MIDSSENTSPWFNDFPALRTQVYDKPLVYLDSAATAQTPQIVIDRMTQFYQHDYASVHRGVHYLSSKATEEMEQVREKLAQFISAKSRESIVFTKGTTEAINLVANSYLRPRLKAGDEIIVTEMEHHANLVPWQMLSEIYNVNIRVWPMAKNGYLNLNDLVSLMNTKTKLLAISHVSNVLGRVNPIKTIVKAAHKAKVPVLVDGAQAVMHDEVNVTDLDCDFYAFSGHKLYGPTGIGVLYAKNTSRQHGAMGRRRSHDRSSDPAFGNLVWPSSVEVRSGHSEYCRHFRFRRRSRLHRNYRLQRDL